MAKKQVVVDITSEGFTVNINGMTGTGCEAISKAFASAGEVVEHKKKPEYFKNAKALVNVTNSQ